MRLAAINVTTPQREHALWGSGVDRIAQGPEIRATGFQLLDDLQEVLHRSRQSIETDYDECLSRLDAAQKACQNAAAARGAGDELLMGYETAGGPEFVSLRIGSLVLR